MKTFVRRELPFLLVFALAVVLLLVSSSNVARSAERFESKQYEAHVQASEIGVTLKENGAVVSYRDNQLASNDNEWNRGSGALLRGVPENVEFGALYREELSILNSGKIPVYCRLIIRKYWTDGAGNKLQNMDPDLIRIGLSDSDKWVVDNSWKDAKDHPETLVLVYTDKLEAGKETTAATKYVSVDNLTAVKVSENWVQSDGRWKVTTEYSYEGLTFVVEAEANAVQTHNAADALTSAWGYIPEGVRYSAD